MWPSPYPSHTLLNLHFVIPTLPFVIAVISSRLFSARAARFSHPLPFCGEGVAGGREGTIGKDISRCLAFASPVHSPSYIIKSWWIVAHVNVKIGFES